MRIRKSVLRRLCEDPNETKLCSNTLLNLVRKDPSKFGLGQGIPAGTITIAFADDSISRPPEVNRSQTRSKISEVSQDLPSKDPNVTLKRLRSTEIMIGWYGSPYLAKWLDPSVMPGANWLRSHRYDLDRESH